MEYNSLFEYTMYIDNTDFRDITRLYSNLEITKEDNAIYTLFEQLYNRIKNASVFDIDTEIALFESGLSHFDSLADIYDFYKENVASLKESDAYHELFDGKTITWCSDEIYDDSNDLVKINFDGEKFILEFAKRKQNELLSSPYNIPVRFSNSGSRYNPFNVIFMRMFQDLQKYNTEFHQIHIEEYLYNQKILKK